MKTRRIDWRRPLWPPGRGSTAAFWNRLADPAVRLLPLVLLALPTAIRLVFGGRSDLGGTLALTGLAAVIVLATLTLPPPRVRDHTVLRVLSFTGVMAVAAVLEARETPYLLFMIMAFLLALRVRPAPMAFAGIAITSLLINTLPTGGPVHALRTDAAMWLSLVAVQTLLIGSSGLVGSAVSRQSEERQRALDALAAAQAENEGLHRQLLSQARESGMLDERQRLSQEIHDTLAQGFTGIITQLEAAKQSRGDSAEWARHLDLATALARENLTAARRSVHALHPEPLESAALPDALAAVTRQWGERTGVAVEFTTTGTAEPLHPEIEATLLRITQEALSNVDKHAAAARVGLTLSYMADEVTLDVRDDGAGFDPGRPCTASSEHGFGLPGMRRRVQRLAGTLHVESEPGVGTAISANLPAIPLGAPE